MASAEGIGSESSKNPAAACWAGAEMLFILKDFTPNPKGQGEAAVGDS